MDTTEARRGLSRLLAGTARAHHAATGGVNANWAQWYAKHLAGQIDEYVGFSPTTAVIEGWLVAAEQAHGKEDPEGRWPPFYAAHIIDQYARA